MISSAQQLTHHQIFKSAIQSVFPFFRMALPSATSLIKKTISIYYLHCHMVIEPHGTGEVGLHGGTFITLRKDSKLQLTGNDDINCRTVLSVILIKMFSIAINIGTRADSK